MVIVSTEILPLDRVVDLANLDNRGINSIFEDAMLLEVSSVSHDLMQQFHGSLVEPDNSMDKNH